MFQPLGVKTLMQMRAPLPPLPGRPSSSVSEEGVHNRAATSLDLQERCPTAPPELISRTRETGSEIPSACSSASPCVAEKRQAPQSDHLDSVGEELLTVEDLPSLLLEAGSFLQQLQTGWQEERQDEISRLWRQCEAEYGFELSRDAPGTPALGSLRARGGYGASGLLGAAPDCRGSPLAATRGADAAHSSASGPSHHIEEDEIRADETAKAAQNDLLAIRQLRQSIEDKLHKQPKDWIESSSAAVQRQRQLAFVDAQCKSQRLVSLREEVERLREKATAMCDESVAVPPAAAAALAASEVTAPDLDALDDWMQDLRRLCKEAKQDGCTSSSCLKERAARAVASPMRSRNSPGMGSPNHVRSPRSLPTQQEMARVAEQRAMEASSTKSPRAKEGLGSPNRTPKAIVLANRGGLCGAGYESTQAHVDSPNTRAPASAVERQLDDILKELDEIDRIHDDVCMLSTS